MTLHLNLNRLFSLSKFKTTSHHIDEKPYDKRFIDLETMRGGPKRDGDWKNVEVGRFVKGRIIYFFIRNCIGHGNKCRTQRVLSLTIVIALIGCYGLMFRKVSKRRFFLFQFLKQEKKIYEYVLYFPPPISKYTSYANH